MGVQMYLLDQRMVTLLIDGLPQKIGTVRSFWKLTELTEERGAEVAAVEASIRGKAAPVAVMIAGITEAPLAIEPDRKIASHMVLGWDADRPYVTDYAWDYLPILGYAVRFSNSNDYVLHEDRGGLLYPITKSRAEELNLLTSSGRLVRCGQPSIVKCHGVKQYINDYVEADCVLGDGQNIKILTAIKTGNFPESAWYVGKRPVDVAAYPSCRAA